MTNPASDSKGTYVVVQKGDTLSHIAQKHYGGASKYQALAKLNNISNPNLIYVGQKVYIKLNSTSGGSGSGSGSSSGSSSSSNKSTNSNQVTITAFGVQANTDNTLFVTWTWSKESQTEKYLVEWTYGTGDGVSFIGSSTSNTVDEHNRAASRQSTYSIPANARTVKVRIKPISKTYTKNKKETTYWTASWSTINSKTTWTDSTPLDTPGTPSIEIDKYKLTTKLEGITETEAKQVEFQIYKNDGSSAYKTGKATITATKMASYSCTVDAGGEYKVRCRLVKDSWVSEWSPFSGGAKSIPATPSGITDIRATSDKSIYLEWAAVDTAETYDIEYSTKESYFDNTTQTSTQSGIELTHFEFIGLEIGVEYFFRVRAVNQNGEFSGWSGIKSIVIGEKPVPPTTWSSTTTAVTGEDITLYWVHNSGDNSSQTYAELELIVNGTKLPTITVKNTTKKEDKDKTSHAVIDTVNAVIKWTEEDGEKSSSLGTSLIEGVKIQWRVRTAGITKEYGDWSVQRTINIYAPATLELHLYDKDQNELETLTSFPWHIYGIPGPSTQTPLSYHVTVIANESYVTTDNVGNEKIVSKGSSVYSEFFDLSAALDISMTPGVIDLENGISYTVTCVVSMNSGLNAVESREFTVAWTDEIYTPNAEISYDPERYVAHIRPYCYDHQTKCYKVDWANDKYTKTSEEFDYYSLDDVYTTTDERVYVGTLLNGLERYYCIVYVDQNGNSIDPVHYIVNYSSGFYTKTNTVVNRNELMDVQTTTGESVLMGVTEAGDEIRYCLNEGITLVDDITLSVYRREYDGRFVEIGSGLKNVEGTTVTDPHPALDYARYRVVAISDTTGAVSFYDIPGYPINEVGVIIQWDEDWSTFDITEESELQQPAWTGSLIRLPYNIDVSESNNVDVAHVEYTGRQHPVSYHGTHLGTTGSWKVDIPKIDKETIYGLRRLMIYMGNVYVREPSGVGYWATIKVSFSQTHCEVAVPVSLEVTRVEGGV